MNLKKWAFFLFSLILTGSLVSCGNEETDTEETNIEETDTEETDTEETDTEETVAVTAKDVIDKDSLKAFVESAVTHLETDYEQALDDFQNKEEWIKDSIYIFISDLNSIIVFQPVKPSLVGVSLETLKDKNGVAISKELIKAAQQGGGFVTYLWDNPTQDGDEVDGSPKTSYAKLFTKSDGTVLAVGAGIWTTQ